MTRVLDVDLDFFLNDVAFSHGRDDDRLDPSEFWPWPLEQAIEFLEQRCLLRQKVPGIVVEHHDEVFYRWRGAIAAGALEAPLQVTHVDAHADLGMGDPGYTYLMSDLLFRDLEDRRDPQAGYGGLDFSNWLLFAIANRWLSELTYVFIEGGGNDIFRWHLLNFEQEASALELKAVTRSDISRYLGGSENPPVAHREPPVPFRQVPWEEFQAQEPYDLVCLTRSPSYTPEASDYLFDEIRSDSST